MRNQSAAIVKINVIFFFFQAEDGIRDYKVTGVQTCALPISSSLGGTPRIFPVGGKVASVLLERRRMETGFDDHSPWQGDRRRAKGGTANTRAHFGNRSRYKRGLSRWRVVNSRVVTVG